MTDAKPKPAPLIANGADPLSGRLATPGDTAISQRALLLAALAVGTSTIAGIRASQDVLTTAAALRQAGVKIEQSGADWQVHGLGVAGLLEPQEPLEPGRSAMGMGLLMGLLAPYDFVTEFNAGPGLESGASQTLRDGLDAIGAQITPGADGGMRLQGALLPLPLHQRMTTPDDESKAALLLAGVQIAGISQIHEAAATRDHTEKLLAAFGADITVTPDIGDGDGATIRLVGRPELTPQHISVPGDPSAAAFWIVAALIVKGSDLVVENVLINPLRTGLIDTLLEMGGDIQFLNQREIAGEHVADLRVRSSWLKGIVVNKRHANAMLDDLPTLAIAAAFAQGETVIEGLAGLDGTNSDRLDALAAGLSANKVTVTRNADSLTLAGDGKVAGGGTVDSRGHASVAMSFAVMGLASRHKVTIKDASAIADSFPDFVASMTTAGGRFPPNKGR